MRTGTQTGLIVGVAAGLLTALLYWLLQAGGLLGLVLYLLVALVAGGAAAALTQPMPLPNASMAPALPGSSTTTPAAPPSVRGQQVRAAAWAGTLSGLGAGLMALLRVVTQLTDSAVSADFNSQLVSVGVPSGSVGAFDYGILGCGACFTVILFPALCAGVGALGGYIWTALRPMNGR